MNGFSDRPACASSGAAVTTASAGAATAVAHALRRAPAGLPCGAPAAPPPLRPAVVPLKGRGTSWRIASRHAERTTEPFDDGWGSLDGQQAAEEETLPPATQLVEQRARTILAANDSPDIPFDLSINPYRGCEHGCVYCFARPTHGWLDLSPGLDFETRIVAKVNAAERLRAAFARPGYVPKRLNLGSATDAYQPAERRLRITRGVIEVLAECSHAFSLVTKSAGVERDIDLLAPLAARRLVAVYVSLTTLDPALARTLEPRAPSPQRRLRTIETLAAAGVPVGVSVSPLIPFVNEGEIERLLAAARAAGARSAFGTVLRLPGEVAPLFERWLAERFPDRAARVMARVRDLHGGKPYDARHGLRMTGAGVWARLLAQRFDNARERFGYDREPVRLDLTQFRPPAGDGRQRSLF